MNKLIIGEKQASYPIIQGGMGVGISLSSLAGAVALAGGVGIISTAQIGFKSDDFKTDPVGANLRAIGDELKKARAIAPEGIIGFNIMVATNRYDDYVTAAVKAGADIIISGAGLPTELPAVVKAAGGEGKTAIAPIVSSAKAASVICRFWDKRYNTIPDLIVVEGPLAGGHLGFSPEALHDIGADTDNVSDTYKRNDYDREIKEIINVIKTYEEKYEKKIPVIVAGGIYDHDDFLHAISLGADGVQAGTRFVTTYECDAPDSYKQAYIDAKEEDIVIIKSPVGMPGRAIKNKFLEDVYRHKPDIKACYRCLKNCDPGKIPYCITDALTKAALGDIDNALLFCGSNACRAEKIESVKDVIEDICRE